MLRVALLGPADLDPVRMTVGVGRPFSLQTTTAPDWADDAFWKEQYKGQRIRLTLHCVREDYGPWTVPLEMHAR
jgi:hypothetical protein